MDSEPRQPSFALIEILQRPAAVVAVICQMLLGLGLAVMLILRVYMRIFTDQVCISGGTTLGNMIRCMPPLGILAHVLILLAGFRFAALMFTPTPTLFLEPLLLALTGILLTVLAGLTLAGITWYLPLTLLVLFGALGCVFAVLHLWRGPSANR